MEPKRIIIVGASGMIGGLSLQASLASDDVGAVTVLVRSSLGVSHPKLREVVADYSALAGALAGQDASPQSAFFFPDGAGTDRTLLSPLRMGSKG